MVDRITTKLSTFIVSALLRTSDEGFSDPPLGSALVAVLFNIWHSARTITLVEMKFIEVL